MSKYTNIRVQALIEQQIRDQLADELLCDHGDGTCDKRRGHRGRHDVPCDDPGCCEPRELDAETVAAIRYHHFGGY